MFSALFIIDFFLFSVKNILICKSEQYAKKSYKINKWNKISQTTGYRATLPSAGENELLQSKTSGHSNQYSGVSFSRFSNY